MTMTIRVGDGVRYQGVSVFPLFLAVQGKLDYRLSDEAIGEGTVTIGEVSEGGSVPELIVENKGSRPVLFLEGEELVGAKQNRILNTSVLVAAGSTVKIPVSCVEQGRWRYRSRQFGSSGHHSSSKLRYHMARSVTRSVEANRGHRSDQGQVWQEVRKQQQAMGVASETASMSDTYNSYHDVIARFREKLVYVDGASGMAVAVGSKVVTLDLFDKPETCRKAWSRLLSGFVMDSLQEQSANQQPPQREDAQRLVDLFEQVSWKHVEAVGEGEEFRAETATAEHAFKLCLDGAVVHASVLTPA